MERVLVIGSPGAGKSTLARQIADRIGLPLIHLDAERWQSGWIERDRDEWQERLDGMVARPSWVIDGNYGSSLPQRLARADTVIDLNYPTWLCLWRVLRRVVSLRGRVRPDMAAGCPERFDLEFLAYVALFRRDVRPANAARIAGFTGRVLRFSNPAATESWLSGLANRAADR